MGLGGAPGDVERVADRDSCLHGLDATRRVVEHRARLRVIVADGERPADANVVAVVDPADGHVHDIASLDRATARRAVGTTADVRPGRDHRPDRRRLAAPHRHQPVELGGNL